MYFITTKRMLEVCFSAHPNIQYRTYFNNIILSKLTKCVVGFCGLDHVQLNHQKKQRTEAGHGGRILCRLKK